MRFRTIDYSTIDYWGIVINIFLVLFITLFSIHISLNLLKGINPFNKANGIKTIKTFIDCIYVSIITILILIALAVLTNNKNVDIEKLAYIIMFLGFIKHFYYDIVEVIIKIKLIVKKKLIRKKENKL